LPPITTVELLPQREARPSATISRSKPPGCDTDRLLDHERRSP
jgi:hypothetical protein